MPIKKLAWIALFALMTLSAPIRAAAPEGFAAWTDASGSMNRTTLTARVEAATGDRGRAAKLYVVASLSEHGLYALSPTGWSPVIGGQVAAHSTVTLGSHTLPLVTAADLGAVKGLTLYAGYGSDANDMLSRQTYQRIYSVGGPLTGAATAAEFLTFSINVQDFSYPDLSAATVTRVVDLHELYQLPVDIYLSDTMLDMYQTQYPTLMQRLTTSAYVGLNYHIRPPKPYYNGFDWAGIKALSVSEQTARIKEYEQKVTDPVTGLPGTKEGGYATLMKLPNARPGITAAFQAEEVLLDASASAFKQLGATWTLAHTGTVLNLGDQARGLYIRPEHFDLLLFQSPGVPAAQTIDAALSTARSASTARMPYFVGVKMHDNDFFAQRSAWLTVYMDGSRRPPWNPALKAALKSSADQEAQWLLYEQALQYAKANASRLGTANSAGIAQLRGSGPATVHVSGTMHIESNMSTWPNIDALLAFFQRAVAAGKVGNQATGMRWSIGADINWLEREPRAGEVIRTLSAMGVEWDIHAHNAADRIRCVERIRALGGSPNTVVSGLLASEIDSLRSSQSSATGPSWQPEYLWGLVTASGHTLGSDDTAAGLWRPTSAVAWDSHDPAGNLVAVGNGGRTLTAAESLIANATSGSLVQPVYSTTLNVAPKTLKIVGTTDGIEQIEQWANRMAVNGQVKWSTIRETALAWRAGGDLPSRINP